MAAKPSIVPTANGTAPRRPGNPGSRNQCTTAAATTEVAVSRAAAARDGGQHPERSGPPTEERDDGGPVGLHRGVEQPRREAEQRDQQDTDADRPRHVHRLEEELVWPAHEGGHRRTLRLVLRSERPVGNSSGMSSSPSPPPGPGAASTGSSGDGSAVTSGTGDGEVDGAGRPRSPRSPWRRESGIPRDNPHPTGPGTPEPDAVPPNRMILVGVAAAHAQSLGAVQTVDGPPLRM